MQLGEDANLLDDVVDFVFSIFDVDDFDGDGVSCTLVQAFVDFAEGSAADASLFVVESGGVDVTGHHFGGGCHCEGVD